MPHADSASFPCEGELEIVLEYAANTDHSVEGLLESQFDYYMVRRDVSVQKYPAINCPVCDYRLSQNEVLKRLNLNKSTLFCANCGAERPLPPGPTILKARPAEPVSSPADLMTRFKQAAIALRDRLLPPKPAPKIQCFVSYAWGEKNHETWVQNRLTRDLKEEGLEVILDQTHNWKIGHKVPAFIELIPKVLRDRRRHKAVQDQI